MNFFRKTLLLVFLIFIQSGAVLSKEPDATSNFVTPTILGRYIQSMGNDDAIEHELLKCMESNGDMRGMGQCNNIALKQYDQLLSLLYQEVLEKNNKELQDSLKVSQRNWIVFRDAEMITEKAYNNNNHGTIMGPVLGSHEISIIKNRCQDLLLYTGIYEQ